jgi:hypothetical protein
MTVSKKKRKDNIMMRMDSMALALLESAKGDGVAVSIRLDVFDKVGKWLAVKFKVEDDDSGAALADYKKRIRRELDADGREARRAVGRREDNPDGAGDADGDGELAAAAEPPALGGPALNAIRQSLPRGGAGGVRSNSPSPGGARPAAFIRDGGILPVAAGAVAARRTEAGE